MAENEIIENSETDVRETEESDQSLVDRAEAAAAALKSENDRKERLLKEERENRVRDTLGGQSKAGVAQEKPREETPQEYVKRIMGEQ